MKLHEDVYTMREAVQAAAAHFQLRDIYIEKDYWVTRALKNIAKSELREIVVFKGGTSLSKGYNLIQRFSEDVDLALIPDKNRSQAQTKKALKKITSFAGEGLIEVPDRSEKYSQDTANILPIPDIVHQQKVRTNIIGAAY